VPLLPIEILCIFPSFLFNLGRFESGISASIRRLTGILFHYRDLKKKYLIIENFIPPAERMKILQRAEYDDNEEKWKLKPITIPVYKITGPDGRALNGSAPIPLTKRPCSAVGSRRPVSEYAKKQNNRIGSAARYKVFIYYPFTVN
jgi:hypothetical protein